MTRIALVLLCLAVLSAGTLRAQDDRLKALATTTIIADVARNVGGDWIEVGALVPPDSDVHAFQPASDDLVRLAEADLVLVNGAGFETFLGDLLDSATSVEPVVVSNGVEMLAFGNNEETEDAHEGSEVIGILGDEGVCQDADASAAPDDEREHASCDPHVWTDPNNVIMWTRNMAEAFSAADPAHEETYRANADAYIAQLEALDAEVHEILSAIPDERRVLVTNHEFLGYFAHAYGFEVVGAVIGGGSTLSEPDPQALARLVEVIEARAVPAIFAEISANPELAEAIASEARVAVVTTLYSDSLSGPDGPASTYIDYLRYNATTIAEALG